MDLDKEELEATKWKQKIKVKIQLEDLKTHRFSNYVDVEDIIRNPEEVEFNFEPIIGNKYEGINEYETLNYNDFRFFQNDYKIHYLIGSKKE